MQARQDGHASDERRFRLMIQRLASCLLLQLSETACLSPVESQTKPDLRRPRWLVPRVACCVCGGRYAEGRLGNGKLARTSWTHG